ncbi:hypothetical protein [Anaeromyxobacter terrae]|uniref:hypothetical protein n=1 Tax=Anaeromyxobacter terrae TaxID=2925406 RepID=UPI001F58B373|nr:hypothetical protein [Anaeromyxobacter sp. SG22]
MMPMEPICHTSASFDGGFKYNDQFAACRIDMQSFAAALDQWCECVIEDLRTNFNVFVDRSRSTLECLNAGASSGRRVEQAAVVQCAEVDVPIDRYYNLDARDVPPLCIKKQEFFPRDTWSFDRCQGEVLEYSRSMKRSIEKGTWDLQEKAMSAADDLPDHGTCDVDRSRGWLPDDGRRSYHLPTASVQ